MDGGLIWLLVLLVSFTLSRVINGSGPHLDVEIVLVYVLLAAPVIIGSIFVGNLIIVRWAMPKHIGSTPQSPSGLAIFLMVIGLVVLAAFEADTLVQAWQSMPYRPLSPGEAEHLVEEFEMDLFAIGVYSAIVAFGAGFTMNWAKKIQLLVRLREGSQKPGRVKHHRSAD